MDTLITKKEAVELLQERQKLIKECSAYGGEDHLVDRIEEIDDIIATFCFKNFLEKKMTKEEIMPFLGIILTDKNRPNKTNEIDTQFYAMENQSNEP